jgi:hypothetical protein
VNLTQLPNTGVSRDTATTAAPAGLVGVAEALNQTGVFIYAKHAVKIWTYSGGAWSEATALTGDVGSRTHTVDWANADRLWIQSLGLDSVTVRMVAQTGALGAAQLGSPVSTWASLTDTPGNFTGQSGKYVKVKDDETGIEFVASGAGGGTPGGNNRQLQYNNDGSFGGTMALYWDSNFLNLGVGTSTFNNDMSNSIAISAGAKPTAGEAGQATISAAQALVPSYTDLKLLCHFEDLTDSSTLDNGSAAVTVAGSISAEEAKFGSNSLKSESGGATGKAWSIAATGDEYNPGTADFTIEFWMKAGASMVSGSKFVFGTDCWRWGGPARQIAFLGNRLYQGNTAYSSGLTIPADTWTHIVIQRRAGTLEYYMNGENTGTSYSNWGGDIDDWSGFQVGRDASDNYGWDGYIDELAVAIGTAKYTENFTVATEAHSSDATPAPAELWVGDGSNNLTQISPHNADNEWEFFSKNVETGRVVRVNMEKMIKRLEEIHGETFMEEWYETPTQNDTRQIIDASTVLPDANPPE